MPASDKKYRPETILVHGGTLRSQFNEMSEALYLTQGYIYESAEICEARFSGKVPGYVSSRYSNPTMNMFETRMAQLEGAEASRSTATPANLGPLGPQAAQSGQLEGGTAALDPLASDHPRCSDGTTSRDVDDEVVRLPTPLAVYTMQSGR